MARDDSEPATWGASWVEAWNKAEGTLTTEQKLTKSDVGAVRDLMEPWAEQLSALFAARCDPAPG